MNINFLKKGKKEIEFEFDGEGHTLFNPLRKILFEDESVVFAGYHVKHPMKENTIFILKTDGSKSAKNALIDGLERLKVNINELKNKFSSAKK